MAAQAQEEELEQITLGQVDTIISKLSDSKAMGLDVIGPYSIRRIPAPGRGQLLQMISSCAQDGRGRGRVL
eukprot:4699062-Pyramimonas_sp.AAC.1